MKSFQVLAFTLSLTAALDCSEQVVADIELENDLVAAAPRWQQNSPSSQVQQVDQKVEQISEKNVHQTTGGKNPSYLEFNRNKVLTLIDVLYWKASEDGLSYVSKVSESGSNYKYKAKQLDFKYEPGFRVGLGAFFAKGDQWDLLFKWTHLNSKANGIKTGNPSLQIPWTSFILGENASKANAHWDLYYNIADVELGRNFFLSRKFAARPFIGLRGAFIDQNYQVKYLGEFVTASALIVEAPTKFKGKDNFWAVGIRPGVDLLWHFNCHWAFAGSLSTTLLYGHQATTSKSSGLSSSVTPLQPSSVSIKDAAWKYRLNVEGALGLQWETYFQENKYHVSMALMYEISQWLSQNQFSQTVLQRGSGSSKPGAVQQDARNQTLGLQGFTYKLDFAF